MDFASVRVTRFNEVLVSARSTFKDVLAVLSIVPELVIAFSVDKVIIA